jgi:tetratricopeptide (TPR) repeat protein
MACLANIFRDTGRHQDEVELRAEVVEGFGQHSGGSDSEAFSQARRLTAILQGLPTVAGREDEIRVLLSHQRRHEAEPDPLARTLTWLGEALSSQERFEAAEEALQEALDLQMETDNYTGPDALRTLMAMAESLQGQERLDEAEPLYIECWDELPESDLARRKKVAQALADLYGALGDSESAEQWLAEISETARAIGR